MIDFRYHLVSIIAIFFALAAGIVLGAGPLGEKADENLNSQLASEMDENQALRQERDELQAELDRQQQFIDEMAPRSVHGELDGRHVAVVALPGAEDDDVEAVQEILEQAGAVADLRVRVEPTWADPGSEDVLDDLAATYVSSGVSLDEEADGHTRGATVLASAIMAKLEEAVIDLPSLEPLNTDTLAAYESGGLIEVEQESSSRATLAVVVAGGISGDDADERVSRLASLTGELDLAGEGVVVTGPGSIATDGGLLAVIRGSDLGDDVSTVDTVSQPSGRVGVVFAVAEQAAGQSGQYGLEGETDGLVPPAPETEESPDDDSSTEEPGSDATGDAASQEDGSGANDTDITEAGNGEVEGEGDGT